jgi:hypothetical protein
MSVSRYLSIFADFLNSSGVLGISGGGTGLTSTPANGQLDIGNGSGFTRATLSAGTGISVTNGAGTISIAATGGGTVTSITAGTGLSGGTITTSGTIALVTTNGAVGTYAWAAPNNTTNYSPGNTIAGSALVYVPSIRTSPSYSALFTALNITLSGTWQAMTATSYGAAGCGNANSAALWIRIA